MAELSGYTCDNCGKHGRDTGFGLIPHSWYKVFPGFDNWKVFTLCSKECLEAWVTGKAPVAVPESKRVLAKKLAKAMVR